MELLAFPKRLKRWVVSKVADQLIVELSERLPTMMAPRMAMSMGMTSLYGPPVDSAQFCSPQEFVKRHSIGGGLGSTALDLGCGSRPQNPFLAECLYGADLSETEMMNVSAVDLSREKLPFADCFFNFVTAHDLIEHIPRVAIDGDRTRFPFIELMNEVSRCLVHEGYFFSQTPAYPSVEAFQDPTHVNFITTRTFPYYFCAGQHGEPPAARMYGFNGSFQLVSQCWSYCWLFTLMRKR